MALTFPQHTSCKDYTQMQRLKATWGEGRGLLQRGKVNSTDASFISSCQCPTGWRPDCPWPQEYFAFLRSLLISVNSPGCFALRDTQSWTDGPCVCECSVLPEAPCLSLWEVSASYGGSTSWLEGRPWFLCLSLASAPYSQELGTQATPRLFVAG